MEFITAILGIALYIGALFLPAVLLAFLMRLPPIYRLAQRSRSVRILLVLGNGLLSLGITYLVILWWSTDLRYNIGAYYYSSTPDQVAGVAPANLGQFKGAIILEMLLRQIIPIGQACFSGNVTVCQLADSMGKLGSLGGFSFIFLGIALIPTMFNQIAAWKYTAPNK